MKINKEKKEISKKTKNKIIEALIEQGLLYKDDYEEIEDIKVDLGECYILITVEDLKDYLNQDSYKNELKKKEFDAIKSSFIAYQLYEKTARESIIKLLENHFNFTITENNNTIEIDIGGDEYRIALERGCIVFECIENNYVENTYCFETIEELIDIITDIIEDK